MRGHRLRHRGAVALVAAALIVFPGGPASAHYSGNGMSAPNLHIKPYSYNSTWTTPMNAAVANWHSHCRFSAKKHSNYVSVVQVVSASTDNRYGWYQRHSSSRFTITLNSSKINADATNFSNFVQSVLAHEFGHGLHLAHNSLTSIMNTSRNRNVLRTWQSHDGSDVNQYYPPACGGSPQVVGDEDG